MEDKFTRVTNKRTIDRDLHDHEVFLGFHADEGAEYFEYWLNTEGWKLFKEYLIKEGKEGLL
jgi:hypothetical protein